MVILLGLHNFYVVTTIWRKKEINRKYLILAFATAIIWSFIFLFSFFGNFNMYFILFLGYLCAVVYNVKVFGILEDKGRLAKAILVYNILGALIVLLKVLSGHGIDFTGLFSSVTHVLTLSHSLFQMLNFSFLQIFYPTLFIPPILLNPKKPKRLLSRIGVKTVKVCASYAVIFMVLASIPSVLMISSFSHIPVFADYKQTPMKFGVKVNSFANEAETMGDWEELLSTEIEIAKALGLDYMEFYVDRSYLEDASKTQKLTEGLKKVKEEGFGIILACMGSTDWFFNSPSVDFHNRTMRQDAVTLAEFHPDYLILIVEPFARHNGMMLQEPLSIQEWVSIINETALDVKAIDSQIKVAVTIAVGEEGLNLFKALQTGNLDAVGVDVHPFHADMVDVVCEYAESASPEKELWVYEFGMETYNFGEETQAKYMGYLPKIASDLQFFGVVQYDIMDNPQSQLGLVYANGEKKLGFYAYKNAIERIRGNYPDFSEVLEEKQKDNGIFILILVFIFSYIVLGKIKDRKMSKLPVSR